MKKFLKSIFNFLVKLFAKSTNHQPQVTNHHSPINIHKDSRFKDLLLCRPDNMAFNKYKAIQTKQNKKLKDYLQNGLLYYKSWEIINQNQEEIKVRRFMPLIIWEK
jgi:hypothetical protein